MKLLRNKTPYFIFVCTFISLFVASNVGQQLAYNSRAIQKEHPVMVANYHGKSHRTHAITINH